MSINPCTAISPRPDGQYRTQSQDAAGSELLKLPPHVIGRIGNFVATGNTPLEAATNGVHWSRVCVYTHVTSHESGVTQTVQQALDAHRALEDEALLKIWRHVSRIIYFNPRQRTIDEIKAWFDDPANVDHLNAITDLDLCNYGLKAIPPQITKFTQLQSLNLANNRILDVSPLKNLSQLRRLQLPNNQITDVSALANLAMLRLVNLMFNPITDFSFRENLPQCIVASSNPMT
ncbi:MAG: hypothetical protein JSS60_06250 [Verrucomicrobia bacterium]|nr:hypothetical protein [Verrucomicrobiota bacterium]